MAYSKVRQLVVVVVASALCVESGQATAAAQVPILEATRARVRALYVGSFAVEIRLVDGTGLQGRIIRADADAFIVKEEKTGREVPLQYDQVVEIRKTGLPGNAKRAIAAASATSSRATP
jgi:hypothetical protein